MIAFRNFLLVCLMVFPLIAQSQYAETIRTARPGFSIGPFTLGKKVFQVQSGMKIGKSSNDMATTNNFQLSSVFRFGLTERVEMSAVIAYSDLKTTFEGNNQEDNLTGLNAAQLGFRVNLLDGKGTRTSIGIQSRVKLNILSEDFNPDKLATTTLMMISQPFGGGVGLTANLGINTPGTSDRDPDGIFSLNLSFPLSDKVSSFVEGYSTLNEGEDLSIVFDTGLAYLVNPDLQLDFSLGYGKNDDLEDLFFDFGFSWRTDWRE